MQRNSEYDEELVDRGRRMREYADLNPALTEEQKALVAELRKLVPEGTPDSKLQSIILSSKGNRSKMELLIADMWNDRSG